MSSVPIETRLRVAWGTAGFASSVAVALAVITVQTTIAELRDAGSERETIRQALVGLQAHVERLDRRIDRIRSTLSVIEARAKPPQVWRSPGSRR